MKNDNIVIMTAKGNRCTDCRLVMLGATGVGKSALVVRFLTKRFIWEYDPTLECTYRHQALVDDESISSEILDTAGQNENCPLNEGHIRWGDGFILVYSIADRDTFQEIQQIKHHLDEIKRPKTTICALIANKTDLEHQRCISTEEGEKLASEMCCAFFETSACNGGDNINDAFHEIFREVKRRKIMDSKPRRRSSTSQMKQVFNKMFTKIQNG